MLKKQEMINRLSDMTINNVPLTSANLAEYFLLENQKMYRQQMNNIQDHAYLHYGEYVDRNLPADVDYCQFVLNGAESITIEIKRIDGNWYFSKMV